MMPIDLNRFKDFFKEYTELRFHENRNLNISAVNGSIINNSKSSSSGISVRVNKNGKWGFASNPLLNDDTAFKVIKSATDNAVFLNKMAPGKLVNFSSRTINTVNDFKSLKQSKTQNELIDFILNLSDYIKKTYQDVSSNTINLGCRDMEKSLLTSDGSSSYSMIPRSIIYISITITKNGEPIEIYKTLGGFGQFEDVFDKPEDLYRGIDELYTQVKNKSEGIYAESGIKDVVLDADLAGILAHEAIGHTTEADLVLGGSVAGDLLGKKIASEKITLVDYANTALGKLCPVPVFSDDEGTKAEDCIIIENGILKRFMHNKESAQIFNHELTGNARAYTFSDEPLIRMRNTAINPGSDNLNDMISSIEDGYYLMKSGNGQADSTSEFMFAVLQGYEIKNGKIGRALKDLTISGIAVDVLQSVSMVSNDMVWSCSGMCGKKQMIPVGLGGPAIKCRVNIGGK